MKLSESYRAAGDQKKWVPSADTHRDFSRIAILFRMNSLYRANICACAAIGAYIRIYFINVTL
jgi:hypothetical protein